MRMDKSAETAYNLESSAEFGCLFLKYTVSCFRIVARRLSDWFEHHLQRDEDDLNEKGEDAGTGWG